MAPGASWRTRGLGCAAGALAKSCPSGAPSEAGGPHLAQQPFRALNHCLACASDPCAAQTPDAKKEEFRKYLEKAGVIDSMTKGASATPGRASAGAVHRFVGALRARCSLPVAPCRASCAPLPRAVLVGLYEEPERPPNAVEYIKRYLGSAAGTDVEALRAENERLREENDALAAENDALRAELEAAHGEGGMDEEA